MFDFSLVIPTIGRQCDLSRLLQTLLDQAYALNRIEVIIVDQNPKGYLASTLMPYQDNMVLKYLHVDFKSLSKAKNIGMLEAKGRYVSFPDDDCWYYPDTLSNAWQALRQYDFPDFIIGRVYDRAEESDVFNRLGPFSSHFNAKQRSVSKSNLPFIYNAISLFVKREKICKCLFDERFGLPMSGCEDLDMIYTMLRSRYRGMYVPSLQLGHPYNQVADFNKRKLYCYAHGQFVRKHHDCFAFSTFLMRFGKNAYHAFRHILRLDGRKCKHALLLNHALIKGCFSKLPVS